MMTKFIDILVNEGSLWMPRIVGVIAILIAFYILAKIIKGIIIRASRRLNLDKHLTSLFARISSITIIVFGAVTALGTLGINVSALVAGLGLTGFALGFALKDTISNLLSGILILLYQPFKIGQFITISGYKGIVVSIDLRYTELRSGQDRVLIPNSKLFTDPITVLAERNDEASQTEGSE